MNKNKISKPLLALAAVASLGAGFGVAALASANTTVSADSTPAPYMQKHERPDVMGKITAINGSRITLESRMPGKDTSVATYTVDAGSATIVTGFANKQETTGTVNDLKVGDMIAVQGTVNGTSVTATKIHSGMPGKGKGMMRGGEHGAFGTVTAINGTSITLTGKDGTSYTVNAGSAKIDKLTTAQIGDIHVGDTIGVQGNKDGTTVNADHIMLGMPQKGAQN